LSFGFAALFKQFKDLFILLACLRGPYFLFAPHTRYTIGTSMADYARNKQAYFNYEVLEKYEAGIELRGFEVKSIKSGRASLQGAYVVIRGGEAFLTGATIPVYQAANTPADYDPMRSRRLLLHKAELLKLSPQAEQKGLTLVPLRLYNKKGKIKLGFALVRGKRTHDKRETIKRKDIERETARKFK
jgi:SsrA-binding protein